MSSIEIPKYVQVLLDRIVDENEFRNYSVKIKQGSQVGDGFLSELSSITIAENESDKRLDIVCKIAPFNKNRRKEFFSSVVFDREAIFYNKVMPMFARFQEEKNLQANEQFRSYPKCFAAVADDESEQYVVIMEDLRPKGFKMWNKADAAPIENMRLVMREIGKFHGLSIALKDQRPDEFAEFKQLTDISRTFFQSSNMQGMFDASFDRAIVALKCEEHRDVMRALKSNTLSYFESCLNEKISDRFGVVCHGDFWNNNILYRFNEDGIAEDIRILDWQVLRYLSPAIDLLYNIFTSTDAELRNNDYDNLLKLYHDSLSNTVRLLGSMPDQLFTLDDLKDEMKKCGNFALLLAPMLIQVCQADSSEISNLDEMSNKIAEGETQQELITGLNEHAQQEYDRRLNGVIGDLIRLGYYHKID